MANEKIVKAEKRLSTEPIRFDTSGWELQGHKADAFTWYTEDGDLIGFFGFMMPPYITFADMKSIKKMQGDYRELAIMSGLELVKKDPLPMPPYLAVDIDSVKEVRRYYRNLATDVGLGVIEIDTLEINECLVIRTIFKAPQEPSGMSYWGSIMLPFRDFSYVVKVHCREDSITTGLRETVVFEEMLKSGQIKVRAGKSGKAITQDTIEGWAEDPYDDAIKIPLMRNLAEAEAYDTQFPNHPLTRLRRILRRIVETMSIDDRLKHEPKFEFNPEVEQQRRDFVRTHLPDKVRQALADEWDIVSDVEKAIHFTELKHDWVVWRVAEMSPLAIGSMRLVVPKNGTKSFEIPSTRRANDEDGVSWEYQVEIEACPEAGGQTVQTILKYIKSIPKIQVISEVEVLEALRNAPAILGTYRIYSPLKLIREAATYGIGLRLSRPGDRGEYSSREEFKN